LNVPMYQFKCCNVPIFFTLKMLCHTYSDSLMLWAYLSNLSFSPSLFPPH
jgi:hypothetical protein